ncbi:DUF2243 domain-containing protein [Salinibacterium sp. SYSU T00001]|uniref:DUF2243 domain-containing protein n=1 Tax=Homoserinimonas sedimenticola TaxID=2986805 RepID=UPI002236811B|nr:DUF2243 domain-containing protein [Salinibacterium sedimenticola]MCW4386177.1 DUF2243 domain-containing protein [Salinibacterium sedimenticola]
MNTRTYWGALLLGVAAMAAVDEIVFHQILAWHHFYDGSTTAVALLSDGLLHAGKLFAFVAGFFLMLDARRRETFRADAAWAGFLVGAGAFQLFDGLINHKVLGLHQVRYDVELLPYDLAWNAAGLALLAAGILLTVRARRGSRCSRTP